MINNKAFTLVELLAVIVILGMIMVFSIKAISSSTSDVNNKIFTTKNTNIEYSAILYGQDHFNETFPKTVKVSDLVTNKYLTWDESDKVTDPRGTCASLNNCEVRITKNSSNKKITAEFITTSCC